MILHERRSSEYGSHFLLMLSCEAGCLFDHTAHPRTSSAASMRGKKHSMYTFSAYDWFRNTQSELRKSKDMKDRPCSQVANGSGNSTLLEKGMLLTI